MKRYKISIFGGGEQSSVEMELRPTEAKVVERVYALLFGAVGEDWDVMPWMDVEEVKE